MRRTWAVGMVAWAVAGSAWAAPAAKKVDLTKGDRYQAGDVFVSDGAFTTHMSLEVSDGSGTPQHQGGDTKISYSTITKCIEADGEGRMTHSLVYVKSLAFSASGAAIDESAKGAFVDVKGLGSDRTFEVLGDKVTPSDEAKQALETLFGSASDIDAAQRLSRPRAPLSVGESFA